MTLRIITPIDVIKILSFEKSLLITLKFNNIFLKKQLVMQVRKVVEGDYEIDLYSNFNGIDQYFLKLSDIYFFPETSYEVNLMYKTFQKLLNVLKYANSSYFE